MSEYGIKIKNIQAGSLYEYSLGVRDYFSYTNAMFTNNLLQYFLLENGLKVKNGSTRDIICINFEFGSRTYNENEKHLNKLIEEEKDKKKKESLNYILEKSKQNKDKYIKKSKEELREIFYQNGVDITYVKRDKEGGVKSKETIHYKMLYRSSGKAKQGSCIFICKRLYKKARDFIYMGIDLPEKDSPIIEISAYSSVVTSTIIDTIKINPKNILILKDIDEFFTTKVISIETDKNKHCIARNIDGYKLKNTLFDGQALIEASICPDYSRGYLLLRHHMCKMACFKSNIQLFFKEYYGDNYDIAQVEDMFGNKHYVKDIQLITTDNAMKWLKFPQVTYDYWCDRVFENGCLFGIVKTAHKSKLGDVQKMSYQMVNSLDLDIMENVTKLSKEYIESLKSDNNLFLEYLKNNSNFSNDYEVLVALCEHNWEFTRSEYFRDRKSRIIREYISKFRTGKVLQNADNLVIVGSPYAMLLYSVGDDIKKDDTFKQEEGTIQCFTTRFANNEYLASFRSPFNSKNNMGYLHNVYSDKMFRYFDFSDEIVAVNMIGTDFQDRNNGSDQDSDGIYTTNQLDIVNYAKFCYLNYPTIVNNIPVEKKTYDNTLLNYAKIDNILASAQMDIGEASNLAQLALTYNYNFKDSKYDDYVCILSVLAQVAIDNAKRKFDIDLNKEIKRIKKDMNIKQNGYPVFWKYIKDKKFKGNINKNLKCPMNYLCKIKFKEFKPDDITLPMKYFFKKIDLKEDRRKSKKVENLIEKYSLMQYKTLQNQVKNKENDDYLLLMNDFEEMIKDIRGIYISGDYLGLFSWLINRAFKISSGSKRRIDIMNSNTEYNKSTLLKTLFTINKNNLLEIFSKNT